MRNDRSAMLVKVRSIFFSKTLTLHMQASLLLINYIFRRLQTLDLVSGFDVHRIVTKLAMLLGTDDKNLAIIDQELFNSAISNKNFTTSIIKHVASKTENLPLKGFSHIGSFSETDRFTYLFKRM